MASTSYSLRSKDAQKTVIVAAGVPTGYTRLDVFNSTVNKNGKYKGLSGRVVAEDGIWVLEYKGKILLWWEKPAYQIDNFIYTGESKGDIDACYAKIGHKKMEALGSKHTWHHTGYPAEESHGTMQLVPTDEHESLTHIGGAAISLGKY
jgi:hypothetical protein